mgnify:CR=1 FL=1
MHLFADYLEPLTAWLHLHPNWALFIAFFFAFIESLAVVGSIIPGTVVMTAVGILAGSGVMRIDLTYVIAAFGAILGDTASYFLGYTLSDRIHQIWPFSRYPSWLEYGQAYFERHGGKSVLLGRFIGPIRSIIPVIAGMMRMKQAQFLVANVLSGIAWAVVYITPGILVGTASAELSTEGAGRLFILVLFLLVLIWAVSVGVKWVFLCVNDYFRIGFHHTWHWLQYKKHLARFTRFFTPPGEVHHAGTMALVICTVGVVLVIFSMLIWLSFVDELGELLDLPVYFFFQSLRTQALDAFFVLILCFVNFYTLFVFWLALSGYLIHKRNWRLFWFWFSLALVTVFFTEVFSSLMSQLRLYDAPLSQSTFVVPSVSLTLATALLGFLLLQLGHISLKSLARVLRLTWSILLVLNGFALLYLGEHWITSVLMSYTIGALFALLYWLLYRRHIPRHPPSTRALWFAFELFALAGTLILIWQFQAKLRDHYPFPEQYVLSSQAWWYQKEPILPIYTKNRFGKPVGVFNIQYYGQLKTFKMALEDAGWRQRPNSFMKQLISRANQPTRNPIRPFRTTLYLNKRPVLVMTHEVKYGDENTVGVVLSLWRSNYRLRNQDEPIWLGSLQPYPENKKKPVLADRMQYIIVRGAFSPFRHLLPALQGFEFNTLPLPAQSFQSLPEPTFPLLLMIKETP